MTPWFHPAAEQEIAAALKVGEERGFGLGRELVQEIRRVSALLCDVPNMGEPLDSRHRRFPLRKFPFGLIYRVDNDLLRIGGGGASPPAPWILAGSQMTSNNRFERSRAVSSFDQGRGR